MKKAGEFNGVPIYEDPNAPPNTLYLLNDKPIGTPGFDAVRFRGKELERAKVDVTTHVAYYRHIYRTSFTNKHKVHSCMLMGSWCWRQLVTHPVQAVKQWRASKRRRHAKLTNIT